MTQADVAIVGGGIAGCALAAVLSRGGLGVVVVEREAVYRDRVRGEWMPPWGVGELGELGLRDVAEGVEHANWLTRHLPFDETLPPEVAAANPVRFGDFLPGVPGCLSVPHVGLQEALLAAAIDAGATVHRGVTDVAVALGDDPSIAYRLDGSVRTVGARLVVGADGRGSTVRRTSGVPLSSAPMRVNIAGMLIEGVQEWPSDTSTIGVEDDLHYLVFPQGNGRVRLYGIWDVGDVHRFAGPDRQRRFLDAFDLDCVPGSAELAAATPIGPCVTAPLNDTWTDVIAVDGMVLVGDAAGWSDPTVGQGLSVSFRDVHLVAEALLGHPDWSTSTFDSYAVERAERMRRLRFANASVALGFGFGDTARARRRRLARLRLRDPMRYQALIPLLVGPWRVAAEAFSDEVWAELLAA